MTRWSSVGVLAVVGPSLGCSADPPAKGTGEKTQDLLVPASSATTQELGVTKWILTKYHDDEVLLTTGYDDDDGARAETAAWSANGNGGIGVRTSSEAAPVYMEYATVDPEVTISRHDIETSPVATRILQLVRADLEQFAAKRSEESGGLAAASLQPLDGPRLVKESRCTEPIADKGPTCDQLIAEGDAASNALGDVRKCPPGPEVCADEPDLPVRCTRTGNRACHELLEAARKRIQETSCEQCYRLIYGPRTGGRAGDCPSLPNGCAN